MCYALYIGTDAPCQTSKWDENDRKFYIEDLSDRDQKVMRHFIKPHVYYAGSWQGCGCGFFAEPEWAESENDLNEINATRKCISDLVGFLRKVLETSISIELFVCWEGDQGIDPKRNLEVTPDELLGHSLPFQELDFAIVKKQK